MSNIFSKQKILTSFVNEKANLSMISNNSFIAPILQIPHIRLYVQLFNLKVECEPQLEFGLRCRIQFSEFAKETQTIYNVPNPNWAKSEIVFRSDSTEELILFEILLNFIDKETKKDIGTYRAGFQAIPIKYFKSNFENKETLIARIIEQSGSYVDPKESPVIQYFQKDYKVDSYIIKEEDISHEDRPYLKIKYKYLSPISIGKLRMNIFDVLIKEGHVYYQIEIKRNDGKKWKASSRFSRIEELHNILAPKIKGISEIRFPKLSFWQKFKSFWSSAYKTINIPKAIIHNLQSYLNKICLLEEIERDPDFEKFFLQNQTEN